MFNGEKLAELRLDRGLSQKKLAQEVGTTRVKISNYERNINVPPDNFKVAVARYFNISLDYLMDLTDVEASFVRSKQVVELPKGFPEDLIPEVKHHIIVLYESHLYKNQKRRNK